MTQEDIKNIDTSLENCKIYYEEKDLTYLLRNLIIAKIRNKNNQGNKPVQMNFQTIKFLLKGLIFNSFSFFKKYDYWVFSNSERRKKFNNDYIDRVASITSLNNQDKTIYIENPILVGHKAPTSDIIFSEAFFILFSAICSILFFRKNKIKVNTEKISEIERTHNIKISIQPQLKKIIGQYHCINFILKFRSPKKVFIVYPDGYLGYIMRLKEKKIPVVEFQHGIIYDTHPSYCNFLNTDISYLKPDYILTYGLTDKFCLTSLKYLNPENIVPLGNYILWLYKHKQVNISSYLKEILLSIPPSKKIVAISCTVNDLELFVQFSEEVNEVDNSYYFLLIPRIKNSTIHLGDSSGKIIDIDKSNVYEVITSSDMHLTHISTCALEALYLNKRSFIYEPNGVNNSFFKINYQDVDSLEYISSVQDFINIEKQSQQSCSINVDSLFVDNVDVRFLQFLDKISN